MKRSKIQIITANDGLMEAVSQTFSVEDDLELFRCDDPRLAIKAAIEVEVDAVILDINLPDIDALMLSRFFRANPGTRDLPIIIIGDKSKITETENVFSCGVNDFVCNGTNSPELVARVRAHVRGYKAQSERDAAYSALRDLQRQLENSNAQLEESNRQLRILARIDGLTGIPNRSELDKFISDGWKSSLRKNSSMSILIADIDYFKQFNDHYGHIEGGVCLKILAQAINDHSVPGGNFVARYGGDEFAVIMCDSLLDDAIVVANEIQNIVKALAYPHADSEVSKIVTLSIGIAACVPNNVTSPHELISAADKALYKAKLGGRNRFEVAQLVNP